MKHAPEPTGRRRHDVFIFYGDADSSWVQRELVPRLEGAGLTVGTRADFTIATRKAAAIERAVQESRKCLLVLTPNFLREEWNKYAVYLLQARDPINRRMRLIPLLRERCDLPTGLRGLIYADFTEPARIRQSWELLLKALKAPLLRSPPALPTRSDWHLPHRYCIPSTFTGRIAERSRLTEWLCSELPLCVLRALPGFGKSALSWYWLTHDVNPAEWPRAVWWTFEEPTNSFGQFLKSTVRYLTGGLHALSPAGTGTRVEDLVSLLASSRSLVVMDGLEDDHIPDHVRSDVTRFLRAIASGPTLPSRVLITTSRRPRALTGVDGAIVAGCHDDELKELSPADALAYLCCRGIHGSRVELNQTCARWGRHPQSLAILAGLIVSDPEYPKDIVAARRLHANGEVEKRLTGLLDHTGAHLTSRQTDVLHWLVCLRGQVSYHQLCQMRNGHALKADLSALIERELVQQESDNSTLHVHPVVRRYIYCRLGARQRRAIHRKLAHYFGTFSWPDEPQQAEDLATAVERYYQLVQSAQYSKAYALVHDVLLSPLHFKFGEYLLNIELLSSLFLHGTSKPAAVGRKLRETVTWSMHSGTSHPRRLGPESPQAWTATALAISYRAAGFPQNAAPLLAAAVQLDESLEDGLTLAVSLLNLADIQWTLGQFMAMDQSLRQHVELTKKLRIPAYEVVGHQDLGLRLAYRGLWDQADREFRIAMRLCGNDPHRKAIIWAHRARKELLRTRAVEPGLRRGAAREAVSASRVALSLLEPRSRERHYVRACWLAGAARRVAGRLSVAKTYLDEAIAQCRRLNLVEFEADIILDLAEHHAATGCHDEARTLAVEALAIAERSGYVLQEADAQIFLAKAALKRGHRGQAADHAEKARKLAACDGRQDYMYKVAHDEAEGLCKRIGRATVATHGSRRYRSSRHQERSD